MNETSQPDKHFLLRRYADGYRVAWAIITFATFLKALAVLFGAGTLIATIAIAGRYASRDIQPMYIAGGLAIGLIVFLTVFMLGTLASSLGQILRANLDAAVYACPFLTNAERMRAAELKVVTSKLSPPPLPTAPASPPSYELEAKA